MGRKAAADHEALNAPTSKQEGSGLPKNMALGGGIVAKAPLRYLDRRSADSFLRESYGKHILWVCYLCSLEHVPSIAALSRFAWHRGCSARFFLLFAPVALNAAKALNSALQKNGADEHTLFKLLQRIRALSYQKQNLCETERSRQYRRFLPPERWRRPITAKNEQYHHFCAHFSNILHNKAERSLAFKPIALVESSCYNEVKRV